MFGLSALCIRDRDWRDLDRDYLKLKKRFFQKEIGADRPEYFEMKGSELTRPGSATNRRGHAFINQVIGLCTTYQATLFSVVFLKNAAKPTSKHSLYTMALQYLCERFQIFLEEYPEDTNATLILDSRMKNVDLAVAKSHMSFVFGHQTGRTCDKILEAPMFANSTLTVGLQMVDIMGSCIYTNFYKKNITVPGALDYTHMLPYWSAIDSLQFKSHNQYDGYIKTGFRLIDFR